MSCSMLLSNDATMSRWLMSNAVMSHWFMISGGLITFCWMTSSGVMMSHRLEISSRVTTLRWCDDVSLTGDVSWCDYASLGDTDVKWCDGVSLAVGVQWYDDISLVGAEPSNWHTWTNDSKANHIFWTLTSLSPLSFSFAKQFQSIWARCLNHFDLQTVNKMRKMEEAKMVWWLNLDGDDDEEEDYGDDDD